MVTESTPTHYARLERVDTYVLRGEGFDAIPSDAIGVWSLDNDNPLAQRGTSNVEGIFDIVSKTDTEMTLAVRSPNPHNSPSYLGAILSPDRETIYWMNNTRPLS